MAASGIEPSGKGQNVMERIRQLPISDDEKKELLAECRTMLTKGDSDRLEKIFELHWGVFSHRKPNVARARTFLSSELGIVRELAEYSILLANDPRTCLEHLTYNSVNPLFDKEILKLASNFLGRPVKSVRFNEKTTVREFLTGVMNAVRKAKCCDPVIVLENTEKVKNKKVILAYRRLLSGDSNKLLVDRCAGVSFDLSNVLFVDQQEDYWPPKWKVRMLKWLVLPSILADNGLEERRFLFDETALQMIAVAFEHSDKPQKEKAKNRKRIKRVHVDEDVAHPLVEVAAFLKNNPKISSQKEVIEFLEKKGYKKRNAVDKSLKSFLKEKYLPVGHVTVLGVSVCTYEYEGDIRLIEHHQKTLHCAIPTWTWVIQWMCHVPRSLLAVHQPTSENRFRCYRSSYLSGRILPIEGVGPKSSAAYQWNVRRIVLPSWNRKDVEEEVSEKLREKMEFVFVDSVDELIEAMVESEEETRSDPESHQLDVSPSRKVDQM